MRMIIKEIIVFQKILICWKKGKNSFQKFVYVALIDNKKVTLDKKLPLGNQDIK